MAVTIEEFMIDVSTRMSGNDAQTLAKVGDTVRGLLSTFGKFIGITGGIYGVGAAIRDFVSDAVDLQRVSTATGASVENLSTWVNAMNGAGENGEAFLQTVRGVTSSLQDMFTGAGSAILPFFNELGIAIFDENDKLRDTTEILGDLSRAWDQYTPERQQKIGEMIGLDDSTIRFLQIGGDEVERLLEIQRKLGVVNTEQAKTSKEIQTNYYQLQQIWSAASNMLVGRLLPAVNWIMKGLKSFSLWLVEHRAIIYGFVIGIVSVLAFKLIPVLVAVAAAWVWAMAPVLLVIGLLSALGAAIYYLVDDFLVWKEGGEAAFTGLWEVVDPIITKIIEAFQRVRDYLVGVWEDPKAKWNEAVNYFRDRWKGMSLYEIGKDILSSLWNGMKEVWYGVIKPFFVNANQVIKDNFDIDLLGKGEAVINSFQKGVTSSWLGYVFPFLFGANQVFKDHFGFSLYDEGVKILTSLWEGLKSIYNTVVNYLKQLMVDMQGMVSEGAFREIGQKAGDAVANAIVSAWNAAWTWLKNPSSIDWVGIAESVGRGLLGILEFVGTIVVSLAQLVQGFIEGILEDLWKKVKGGLNEVLSYIGLGSKESGGEAAATPQEIPAQPTYAVGQFGVGYADNAKAQIDQQLAQMRGGDINVGEIKINAPGGTAKSVSDGVTNAFERLRQKAYNMADSGVNP